MPVSRFDHLPTEILLHIFQTCDCLADLFALVSACRRVHGIFHVPSIYLTTLFLVAEREFGPLTEAIQLVTYTPSRHVHQQAMLRPRPALSMALLRQITYVGRVANAWADVYPFLKWRGIESASRRFLIDTERFHARRACYRLWLYTVAFHTPLYPRTSRQWPEIVRSRAALLRPWSSTKELAEMVDLQLIFRNVLQSYVTPSNETVIRRHKSKFPNDSRPYITTRKLHSPNSSYTQQTRFCAADSSDVDLTSLMHGYGLASSSSQRHRAALEGWGDEISHYYLLEDMLKLDPSQLLHLYQTLSPFSEQQAHKSVVEDLIARLDDDRVWFENNGETVAETMRHIVYERGGDIDELKEAVQDGLAGIVVG